jgi:hypothetical protein
VASKSNAFGIYPAAADRNANTAFNPPKANEFDSAHSTSAQRE